MGELITAQEDGQLKAVGVQIAEVVHTWRIKIHFRDCILVQITPLVLTLPVAEPELPTSLVTLPVLTAHHWLPAGSVDDALSPSDIITVAGPPVCLSHGQVAVGVRHGQPSKHGVVRGLSQCPLVLPLNTGPGLLVHLRVASPAPVVSELA